MTRTRLLAATVIALAFAITPITRDAEAAFGLELSTASCAEGGCGYWNPFIDCFCIDLQIPNYMPRCGEADAP
ncbi:hypothetical protein [Candidatus Palauibacter sp.]|uniref:hypothetical protein n=1 Tax=Candidatus Palauibacter sp. TaxID=3101350 RepID=UPI003B022B4A